MRHIRCLFPDHGAGRSVTAALLLSRLDGVKQTGDNRWIARCPAHDDRTPSLSIRELGDGRVLLKCFAECSTADVLAAAGLEFADLYPERPHHYAPRERLPFRPLDVLRCLVREAEIASVAADNLANGMRLTDQDRDRLREASRRLRAAEELTCGK
jgi:hypothetical protein